MSSLRLKLQCALAASRFRRRADGSVAILAAAAFGASAFGMAVSLDAANLYVAKLQNLRVADLSNMAASATPGALANDAVSAVAVETARNIAEINGLASATVKTVAVPSTRVAGALALSTTVSRAVPRLFPGLSGGTASTVGAESIADPGTGGGDVEGLCIGSFRGPTNIYGTSAVRGPSCGVIAKTYLYVCQNAAVSLASASVGYAQGAEKPFICKTAAMAPALSAFTYRAAVTDTIAGHPDILAIKRRLAAMATGWPFGSVSPRSLLRPTVSAGGSNKTYTGTAATLDQGTRYGKLTLTNANLRFSGNNGNPDATCATPTTISGDIVLNGTNTLTFASGCYVVAGYVLSQSAARTTFAAAPGASITFVFQQYIKNDSGYMAFPDATYHIAGNVDNQSGGTMAFGNGTKVFGAGILNGTGALSFGDGPHYLNGGSISNGIGALTFGNGSFYLWRGSMSNASAGSMTFGNGPFYFYLGTVYNISGSLVFGNGPFHFQGGSIILEAGSRTRFGVGNVDVYGGSIRMAGASTTFGYGGSATTGSSTVSVYGGSMALTTQSLTAVGVTFAFQGGTVSLLGGGTINATAPTAPNPSYGYRNILFVVFGGAFNLYQSGAVADTMSGLIYVPISNASIYGSQTVTYPPGGCLQFLAGVLDIYQNARLSVAPCAGLTVAAAGIGKPVLLR